MSTPKNAKANTKPNMKKEVKEENAIPGPKGTIPKPSDDLFRVPRPPMRTVITNTQVGEKGRNMEMTSSRRRSTASSVPSLCSAGSDSMSTGDEWGNVRVKEEDGKDNVPNWDDDMELLIPGPPAKKLKTEPKVEVKAEPASERRSLRARPARAPTPEPPVKKEKPKPKKEKKQRQSVSVGSKTAIFKAEPGFNSKFPKLGRQGMLVRPALYGSWGCAHKFCVDLGDSCAVCGDEWHEEGDTIVLCDGCDVAVHQSCYGIAEVPEGDWFCAVCAMGLSPKQVQCLVCPATGGALKPCIDDTENIAFIHANCVLWNPELCFTDTSMQYAHGVRTICSARRKLECVSCGETGGGAVQCSIESCRTAIHATCTLREKYVMGLDTSSQTHIFCDMHSQPSYEKRRNAILNPNPLESARALMSGQDQRTLLRETNTSMREAVKGAQLQRLSFFGRVWSSLAPFIDDPKSRVPTGPLFSKLCASADTTVEHVLSQPAPNRLPVTSQPPTIVGGSMRPYQLAGLQWMVNQYSQGVGGILGDDMGLGKTLQVISFLSEIKNRFKDDGPHLVVCPLSVLATWAAEFKRWCPTVRVVVFHGPENERNRIKNKELVPGFFDVCVTTYETLVAEIDHLTRRFYFRCLIADEAQRIKNEKSGVGLAVRKMRAVTRLLLTGTPLQNNLHELWALLNFLYPEVFEDGSSSVFDGRDGDVITTTTWGNVASAAEVLSQQPHLVSAAKDLLSCVMLRRTKKEVLAGGQLPPKKEYTVYVPLAPLQRKYYKLLLESNQGLVDAVLALHTNNKNNKEGLETEHNQDQQAKAPNLVNLLMQLRKICAHPYLLPNVEPGPPYSTGPHLVEASSKLGVLDRLLIRLREGGHKAVVYSQFRGVLDVIEDYLTYAGHRYFRLDGSTAAARRKFETNLFNQPSCDVMVYLITTHAGGLGLNLQGADTVILFDMDWNPTWDMQAQDRVHRLGQTKPVSVYRLVAGGTCEERMLAVANAKAKLYATLLDEQASSAGSATSTELSSMLAFGAADLLKDGEGTLPTSEHYDHMIDTALVTNDSQAQRRPSDQPEKNSFDIPHKYHFEGKVYQKSTKYEDTDIAARWVRELELKGEANKRSVKSTTVEMATDEKGLKSIVVSRWSLAEEERMKRLEDRAKAEREAKASSQREWKHTEVCHRCKKDAPLSGPNVCSMHCTHCPRVMHMACAGLKKTPKMGYKCPQHFCHGCGRSGADAGGLLFRCTDCPGAFCEACLEEGFVAVERCPKLTACNYVPPRTAEMVVCAKCVRAKDSQ